MAKIFCLLCFFCLIKPVYAELDKRVHIYEQEIYNNQILGHLLSQQDWAAEVGTDAVLRLGADLSSKKLKAFIVERLEESWMLYFIGTRKKSHGIYYQIEINANGAINDSYKYFEKAKKLNKNLKRLFKATQFGKQQTFDRCTSSYNNVAIPLLDIDNNSKDYYVYFLAATQDPEINIGGGHHRYLIDVDELKVIDHYRHSNDCLISSKHKKEVSSYIYTHMTSDVPNEFHIYMSYLYQVPFYILTINNGIIWKVFDGKIIPVHFKDENNSDHDLQDRMKVILQNEAPS